jgi:hypothetical protein
VNTLPEHDRLRERRACLTVAPNPAPDRDRITILSGDLPSSSIPGGGSIHIDLRYIADRDLLTAAALAQYFQVAAEETCDTLEAYTELVLSDLNNELVPRWIWLRLSMGGHQVIQQDRQPAWSNQGLLATLDFS